MCNVRPEENPTYVDSEPFTTYGVAEVELELSAAEKAAHYQAGICTAVTERYRGRWVGAYRDGVMADGTQTPNSQAYLYETPATNTAVAANGDDAQQLGEAIADAYRDVELTITDGHWRASDQQGQPIPGSQQDTARELWLSTVQFNFGFAILR